MFCFGWGVGSTLILVFAGWLGLAGEADRARAARRAGVGGQAPRSTPHRVWHARWRPARGRGCQICPSETGPRGEAAAASWARMVSPTWARELEAWRALALPPVASTRAHTAANGCNVPRAQITRGTSATDLTVKMADNDQPSRPHRAQARSARRIGPAYATVRVLCQHSALHGHHAARRHGGSLRMNRRGAIQ